MNSAIAIWYEQAVAQDVRSFAMNAGAGTWETLSVVGSVVSIVLAGFAIWQASAFYRWSNQASKDAKQSADAVGESVRKLEELFNHLYNDTFGMMRDTVSDMRRHLWPVADSGGENLDSEVVREIDMRADENVARVREEVMRELRELIERVGSTKPQTNDLDRTLGGVLDKAISVSREAEKEAVQGTIRDQLVAAVEEFMRKGRREVRASDLLDPLFNEFEPTGVHDAFVALKQDGIVDWDGDRGWVNGPNVRVRLHGSAG
jgi:hypothetical protein